MALGDVIGEFSLSSTPSGLAWDGENLWVAFFQKETIAKLTLNGEIIEETSLAGIGTIGDLAWDGNNLWAINHSTDEVIKFNEQLEIIDSFEAPKTQPFGLAWSGNDLWVSDLSSGENVFQVSTTGEVISSFDSGLNDVFGLAWDGENLYVGDRDNEEILVTDKNGNVRTSFMYPESGLVGATWINGALFVADDNVDKVFKIESFNPVCTVNSVTGLGIPSPVGDIGCGAALAGGVVIVGVGGLLLTQNQFS